MKLKETILRILVAVIAIPALLLVFHYGKVLYAALVGIIMAISFWELNRFGTKKGLSLLFIPGLLEIIMIPIFVYMRRMDYILVLLTAILVIQLIVQLFMKNEQPILNISFSLFQLLYVSLLSFLILIRELPIYWHAPYSTGGLIIIGIYISIWACDSAAYFIGSLIGRHKLLERISPKKTWEGAVAGFLFSIVTSLLFFKLVFQLYPWYDSLAIGAIIGSFGQVSDLVESMLKRDVGIKDSSHILPGHGGILDRFDSSILIAPILYLFLLLRNFQA